MAESNSIDPGAAVRTYERAFASEEGGPKRYAVQLRHPTKQSKYETQLATDDEFKAVFHYRCYNVGHGWIKRLTDNGKMVARCAS